MTIAEIREQYTRQLAGIYPAEESLALAMIALEHVCGLSRAKALAATHDELNPLKEVSLFLILDELVSGKPVQYILGETEFYGLKLKVSPSVLIPRPETEELVHWIIKTYRSANDQPRGILDIGTGSGCIALALKKNLPKASVAALDISEAALDIARENAALNDLEIETIRGDILDTSSPVSNLNSQLSVIASNPPYIAASEKGAMHRNVLEHEPHTALFVEDKDPLLFYRRIAAYARQMLEKGGYLFFEINERYGTEIVDMLMQAGYIDVELRKDINGKDRMIRARQA